MSAFSNDIAGRTSSRVAGDRGSLDQTGAGSRTPKKSPSAERTKPEVIGVSARAANTSRSSQEKRRGHTQDRACRPRAGGSGGSGRAYPQLASAGMVPFGHAVAARIGITPGRLDGLARRDGSRRAERILKIGTVLVRDYQGRRHTVTVGPDGYVWEGNLYSSLSAIARAITGTAWSGPRFFALKLSGDRGNGPPDTAHDRGTARHHSSPRRPSCSGSPSTFSTASCKPSTPPASGTAMRRP